MIPGSPPEGITVLWINQSQNNGLETLSDADAGSIVEALNLQVVHLADHWEDIHLRHELLAPGQTPPSGSQTLVKAYFLANSDVADALGYHDVDPQGDPYIRVFTEPVLTNGGTTLSGSLSISACASHEACLTPETRVLTRDLRWVPVGDMEAGDLLIAFDEENPGQGKRRQWRLASVEATKRIQKQCYELTMADGTVVTCSDDHRWLVSNGGRAHWVTADQLRPQGGKVPASRIIKLTETWDEAFGYAEGYLAGAFDGEGHLAHHRRGESITQFRLAFAQCDNQMLESTKMFLKELGIRYTEYLRPAGVRNGRNEQANWRLYISHTPDILKFLGLCRPGRLLAKFQPDQLGGIWSEGQALGGGVEVVSKRFLGIQDVISMATSTKTFVAEGFASHNCEEAVDPSCTRLASASNGDQWAIEVGDPVQNDSYDVTLASGATVAVSDFVTPQFFQDPVPGAKYDYMGVLSTPWTIAPGGYAIVNNNQVFGEHYIDKGQKKDWPTSRTFRRIHQGDTK
jgi:hypothetical protein